MVVSSGDFHAKTLDVRLADCDTLAFKVKDNDLESSGFVERPWLRALRMRSRESIV